MADQPSSAPQLNVSPQQKKMKGHRAERCFVDGINYIKTKMTYVFMAVYTQHKLWPVRDPLHQRVGEDER